MDDKSFVTRLISDQDNAESMRTDIRTVWDDEEKMYVGKQWETSEAPRKIQDKSKRYNSVNNFIFGAVTNTHANITANVPEARMEGTEKNDLEMARKTTYMSRYNDYKNRWGDTWKDMVWQFVKHGCIIGAVLWDTDWIGGTGPNRWIGDVRILNIDKEEIYFDPAIVDLKRDLQDCDFIHRKFRKKIAEIQKKWDYEPPEESNDEDYEGSDPKTTWLYEVWRKGKPEKELFTAEWKKYFNEKAEVEEDSFKAQEYKDMAKGELDGVHLAYCTSDKVLEYIPYVYDDGKYPFIFKILYKDMDNPLGFGMIRQLIKPQILHNYADELEVAAMTTEGLGGMYYQKGALSPKQKEDIRANNSRGGQIFEVNFIEGLQTRTGARVPTNIQNFKEHKQRMVEVISQNTAIHQGISPGANMPYSSIAELGQRADTRTKGMVEILQDFLIELNQLRLSRFEQFYDEERYFRILGEDEDMIEGTFSKKDMQKSWERQTPAGMVEEKYVPEFDIRVTIIDEKPTDRKYYTDTAINLLQMGAIDKESLWYTLENGYFPPMKKILERMTVEQMGMEIGQVLSEVPPDMRQAFLEQAAQLIAQMMSGQQQGMEQQGMEQQPQIQGGQL